jgi:hypothetical protein
MFSVQRLPSLSYFAQEINLPTLTLGSTQQSTPLSQALIAGDMLEYSPLTVQFLVDDGMENYKAIHNWLVGLGFPENHNQYQDFLDSAPLSGSNTKKSYSDATLTILGNTNTPIQTIQFVDLFPESLDSITFLSTSQDVQYLVGSATFRYSYYKFV